MQFAKHICASALQEEHSKVSSPSARSTWCLGLGPVSSVVINVFVAVCAAETELTLLRRLSARSFLADFFVFHVSFFHFVSSAFP